MTEPSEHSITPDPPPVRVGPYQIERELGSGGMGTVYLGRHAETGQAAALKVLPASMSREPGFVARFSREVDAMKLLKSPNIVELYKSGAEDGIYYYAMEYVPGETLTERLHRDKKIPWREVIDIGVQVCRALKAAHNSGIIHRDLKPSNLLLHENGTVKLTDFGIAQVFASSRLTMTGGILGTAEYMSPEQAQGRRAAKPSDLYSLGAVLYVMLTGRPPFTGKSTLDIAQKHRYSQFDSPRRIVPDIPFWLDEIVCKCLSKKPEDRYPDAYVLMLRLQEVPKKVDMKSSGTFEFDDVSETSETITDVTPPSRLGRGAGAELGGTIIRDLFRAQLEIEKQPTSIWDKLFDNVWVLGALFVLLVGGGVAMVRRNHLTADQKFVRGQDLMDRSEGAAWQEAREKYFEPLLKENEVKWGPLVAPYLARIQRYELRRQILGRRARRDQMAQSEPEAILMEALELQKKGRLFEARQRLTALETLIPDNSQYLSIKEDASRLREEIDTSMQSGRLGFLQDAMDRAQQLADGGKSNEALAIWRSLLELYHADPEAQEIVAEAREEIEKHSQSGDESSSGSSETQQ